MQIFNSSHIILVISRVSIPNIAAAQGIMVMVVKVVALNHCLSTKTNEFAGAQVTVAAQKILLSISEV